MDHCSFSFLSNETGQPQSRLKGLRALIRYPIVVATSSLVGFSYEAILVVIAVVHVALGLGAKAVPSRLGFSGVPRTLGVVFYLCSPSMLSGWFRFGIITQPVCQAYMLWASYALVGLAEGRSKWDGPAFLALSGGALIAHEHGIMLPLYGAMILLYLKAENRSAWRWVGFGLLLSSVVVLHKLGLTRQDTAWCGARCAGGNAAAFARDMLGQLEGWWLLLPVLLLRGREPLIRRLALSATWVLSSFVPYAATHSWNAYYGGMAAFGVTFLIAALLEHARRATGAWTIVWIPCFAAVALWTADALEQKRRRAAEPTSGEVAYAALVAVGRATERSEAELESRLKRPRLGEVQARRKPLTILLPEGSALEASLDGATAFRTFFGYAFEPITVQSNGVVPAGEDAWVVALTSDLEGRLLKRPE